MRALLFASLLLLAAGCATSGEQARESRSSRTLEMTPPDQSGLPDGDHPAPAFESDSREKDPRPQTPDLE